MGGIHGVFNDRETILHDMAMVGTLCDITPLSKSTERTKPTVNPRISYGLKLIVTYQQWFIKLNKRTTLIQDFNNKGHCVWIER